MTKTIKYSGEIIISIPDDEIELIIEDFKDTIDNNATEEDLFTHIAHNVIYCGEQNFIEGIGEDFTIEEFEKPELEIEK